MNKKLKKLKNIRDFTIILIHGLLIYYCFYQYVYIDKLLTKVEVNQVWYNEKDSIKIIKILDDSSLVVNHNDTIIMKNDSIKINHNK